jgi:hypothetical protein
MIGFVTIPLRIVGTHSFPFAVGIPLGEQVAEEFRYINARPLSPIRTDEDDLGIEHILSLYLSVGIDKVMCIGKGCDSGRLS